MIRPLAAADLEAVARITHESPEAANWPPESYGGFPGWVAETEGEVVGLAVGRVAADELEILNLAVTPERRRRGIGSALLGAALDHGRRAGAGRAFLEVRESNREARRFYERHGFADAGRRRGYYRGPEEDAVVMTRTLDTAK